MHSARFWAAVDVRALGLGLGLGLGILGFRVGCQLAAKRCFIRVWLGRRLHADGIGYPQMRENARWARFWVAVLVRVLGLGAMKSHR